MWLLRDGRGGRCRNCESVEGSSPLIQIKPSAVLPRSHPAVAHFASIREDAELTVLRNLLLATVIVVATVVLSPRNLNAFELAGAWATDSNKCSKVFARKGRANQVDFTSLSGVHGGGFIADANRLRSKAESCLIKSRKDSGRNLNLIVTCARGVMLSSVQFFLKIVDDNTISREFPGMEEMEQKYYRCKI